MHREYWDTVTWPPTTNVHTTSQPQRMQAHTFYMRVAMYPTQATNEREGGRERKREREEKRKRGKE